MSETKPPPPKLTENQVKILREGTRHRDGVVRPSIAAGYAGVVTRRNVARLEALGLIIPNAHGDHYITEAGIAEVPKTEG